MYVINSYNNKTKEQSTILSTLCENTLKDSFESLQVYYSKFAEIDDADHGRFLVNGYTIAAGYKNPHTSFVPMPELFIELDAHVLTLMQPSQMSKGMVIDFGDGTHPAVITGVYYGGGSFRVVVSGGGQTNTMDLDPKAFYKVQEINPNETAR